MEFELEDLWELCRTHWDILLCLVVGLVLGMLGMAEWLSTRQIQPVMEIEHQVTETEVHGQVVVDVSGAVNRPGIYSLENGSRVNQAIEAAGGFSQNADSKWISSQLNLAGIVNDGSKLYVPTAVEDSSIALSDTDEQTIAQPTININTATLEQLKQLKGVGDVRANQIIVNRPYINLSDLSQKADLSEKIIEDNAHLIRFY